MSLVLPLFHIYTLLLVLWSHQFSCIGCMQCVRRLLITVVSLVVVPDMWSQTAGVHDYAVGSGTVHTQWFPTLIHPLLIFLAFIIQHILNEEGVAIDLGARHQPLLLLWMLLLRFFIPSWRHIGSLKSLFVCILRFTSLIRCPPVIWHTSSSFTFLLIHVSPHSQKQYHSTHNILALH